MANADRVVADAEALLQRVSPEGRKLAQRQRQRRNRARIKALDSMKTTVGTLSNEVEKSKGYIARAEGAAQNRLSGPGDTFKLEAE